MAPFTVVIPARYASTRLPGKPLLDIAGKPMIQHVYERATESQASSIYVATDDQRIAAVLTQTNIPCLMTSPDHPSGTDRLAECASQLSLDDEHIIVNVQGDEPLLPARLITQVAENLANHSEAGIATLCEKIYDRETLMNPNVVKVIKDEADMAVYFSRAPVPWARDFFGQHTQGLPEAFDYYRHIGIYAYRVGFLHDYVNWGSCMLEKIEALEQLRAMWHRVQIHVHLVTEAPPPGVDTQQDLERVRRILEGSK